MTIRYLAKCSVFSVLTVMLQDVSVMDPADVVTPAGYILFYSAVEGQTSLPPLG